MELKLEMISAPFKVKNQINIFTILIMVRA